MGGIKISDNGQVGRIKKKEHLLIPAVNAKTCGLDVII